MTARTSPAERQAWERQQETHAAMMAAYKVYMAASLEHQAALQEHIRISKQLVPVREGIVDALDRIMFGRPGATPGHIAGYLYRPVTEVQAALDDLAAEGAVRQVGKVWELTGLLRGSVVQR